MRKLLLFPLHSLVLSIHNYFRFGDSLYLQMGSNVTGIHMTPQYANIYMIDLDVCFLCSYPLILLVYHRYIVDIFIIWMHKRDFLEKLHHSFNNIHPSIKLTLKYSTQQIHFLDTRVKVCNGQITATSLPYCN